MSNDVLTIAEIAERLHEKPPTLFSWVRAELVTPAKRVGRRMLFDQAGFRRFQQIQALRREHPSWTLGEVKNALAALPDLVEEEVPVEDLRLPASLKAFVAKNRAWVELVRDAEESGLPIEVVRQAVEALKQAMKAGR